MRRPLLWLFTALVLFPACESSKEELLKAPEEQAALRGMQTRIYDSTDEKMILRSVIATLQDLGFVIDDANSTLGIVTGTKLEGEAVRLTVTVRSHGETQTAVRASAQLAESTVTDPAVYRQFFVALSKGMFLTAHEIE